MSERSTTRIRVACHRCGPHTIDARGVTLRVCRGDGSMSVRYACGHCGLRHVEPIDPDAAQQLAACDDVAIETWRRPREDRPGPAAPAINEDDARRFAEHLTDDGHVARSLAALHQEYGLR